MIKSVVVFCGSKTGNDDLYLQHAIQLGNLLATNGIRLIYGGGNNGLMGAVADAVLVNAGEVTGVIPERLAEWDVHHKGLTELIVVNDMHTRKRNMYELADAAIILPGGFGTMDEMFEMLTWNQLSIHNKPVFMINTAGFYSDLFQMMQVMHAAGFLHEPLHKRIHIFEGPETMMAKLISFQP